MDHFIVHDLQSFHPHFKRTPDVFSSFALKYTSSVTASIHIRIHLYPCCSTLEAIVAAPKTVRPMGRKVAATASGPFFQVAPARETESDQGRRFWGVVWM